MINRASRFFKCSFPIDLPLAAESTEKISLQAPAVRAILLTSVSSSATVNCRVFTDLDVLNAVNWADNTSREREMSG